MISIIKTTIKLLLRNKGFLFFLLMTTVLSAFVLSLKVDFELFTDKDAKIIELSSMGSQAVYNGDNYAFIVKVYDSSETELSEYVLNKLTQNGMFSVCRADTRGTAYEDILAQTERDGFNDHAGIIMYLKDGFDGAVMDDSLSDGMELFISSDDERLEIFETELKDLLSNIYRAGSICGKDPSKTIEMLDGISEKLPAKNVTETAGADETVLTRQQTNSKTHIGYAFAIITLGFMFSGVFVSHTVIIEENNKVFTRLMLTGTGTGTYFTAKFITAVLMSALQTGILAVCLIFIKGLDLGMSMPVFLLIIFLLGVVICTISLLTGILFGDIMSSIYAAFGVWSVSGMLSGLYFPIDDTSEVLKALSYLMPQRWFMDSADRFLADISGACPMLLCVTAAYLTVILSVGSVLLKVNKQEP